jgi:hypothetical protein
MLSRRGFVSSAITAVLGFLGFGCARKKTEYILGGSPEDLIICKPKKYLSVVFVHKPSQMVLDKKRLIPQSGLYIYNDAEIRRAGYSYRILPHEAKLGPPDFTISVSDVDGNYETTQELVLLFPEDIQMVVIETDYPDGHDEWAKGWLQLQSFLLTSYGIPKGAPIG